MTWAGLDVHARSTDAAAIDVLTGELTRARFGVGTERVVEWLLALRKPARVVYEAGPRADPADRMHRLNGRLRERGKPHNVVTVAIARELTRFLWAATTAP